MNITREANEMGIKVKPEGREGVWIAKKDSVIDFLQTYEEEQIHTYEEEQIHNYMPGGWAVMGADWDKKRVIEETQKADRIAILTGESLKHNLMHALAVIVNNKLLMFDIGEITDEQLEVIL